MSKARRDQMSRVRKSGGRFASTRAGKRNVVRFTGPTPILSFLLKGEKTQSDDNRTHRRHLLKRGETEWVQGGKTHPNRPVQRMAPQLVAWQVRRWAGDGVM